MLGNLDGARQLIQLYSTGRFSALKRAYILSITPFRLFKTENAY